VEEWIKTIIQTDCQCLVEALKMPMEDRSRYSNIVKEVCYKDAPGGAV